MPLVKDVGQRGRRKIAAHACAGDGSLGATRASNQRCRDAPPRVGTTSGAAAHAFLLGSCGGEGDWRVDGAGAPYRPWSALTSCAKSDLGQPRAGADGAAIEMQNVEDDERGGVRAGEPASGLVVGGAQPSSETMEVRANVCVEADELAAIDPETRRNGNGSTTAALA